MSKIIPKVKNEKEGMGFLDVFGGIRMDENPFGPRSEAAFRERMTEKGINVDVKAWTAKTITITEDKMLLPEAYTLEIKGKGIKITAADLQGTIYALTSLYQLLERNKTFPFIEIQDQPRCSYRGFHVDCARHFFDAEEIKLIIEEASLVKLNRFHWHLSDDQGWRVQVEKYHALYKQCFRKYYTKEQIADIVSFAENRGVMVIPEIDMPGHTRAITAAYPVLSCSHKLVKLAECGGTYRVILCPGEERTFRFINDLLDEMVPMFGSKYFHIGGDEAPKMEWHACPKCQARIAAEGLTDENALQGYFTRRIAAYLSQKYDTGIMCRNDALEMIDDLTGSELLQYWTPEFSEHITEFIKKGGKFIYSNQNELYYDYPESMSPMIRSYTASPVIDGVDYTESEAFAGMECCIRTEYIDNPQMLEQLLFPRAIAMAENAWRNGDEDGYQDFKSRLDNFEENCSVAEWGHGDPTRFQIMKERRAYKKSMSEEEKVLQEGKNKKTGDV